MFYKFIENKCKMIILHLVRIRDIATKYIHEADIVEYGVL